MHTTDLETPQSATDGFVSLDAIGQARLVASGEVSPLELVDGAINRIERLNPHLNVLASSDFELARKSARSLRPAKDKPFAGVPTLLKDLLAYPGHKAGFGSRMFQAQPAALSGSDYTAAIDDARLVVLGKTTTSEFGLLGTTESLAHGPTRNPWNPTLSTGGSSGGAVAAVASGMVPIAHASDGGGSIRGPASFCGLFGFKPSRGRTVEAGLPSTMPTVRLISDHCVSRSVRDSATWLQATERKDLKSPLPALDDLRRRPRPLRIGVYRRDVFGHAVSAPAEKALNAAVTLCEALGHHLVECHGPDVDAQDTSAAFFTLTGVALQGLFDHVATMMGDAFDESLFEPYTVELVRRARRLSEAAIGEAVRATRIAEDRANRTIAAYDILLSPTVPFTAFPLGKWGPTQDPDELIAFTERLAGFTNVASFAGWPAMSVPLDWSEDGLPLGCHFAAAAGNDALLLSLAFQLEEAAPWQPQLVKLAERLSCLSV